MSVGPSGTVSFLFTDIEGSTTLWERDPSGMRVALARHDELVCSTIERFGGYVFSTGGDGFGVAFQGASEALNAGIAIQRAIGAEPWPEGVEIAIRIGINTGEADERNGDYFGQPVNRAARVMSAANGGQILVSETTADLLGAGEGAELVELGTRRLKGLSQELALFGVRAEGLAWKDQPLDTDQGVPGNLARLSTEFVGRIDLLKQRADSLPNRRLVTLTGPGGVGKTRAAVEAGWLSLDRFPGGVWMVELAAVSDPDAVVPAVAATLSVQPQSGVTLTQAILDWLSNRRLLLILDNCEHVLNPVTELVAAIVSECPSTTVLATSREPLGIPAERVLPVASLPQADSEELFRLRAAAADESLVFSPEDQSSISGICQRLDGIPLAVELAAARVRSLSLSDLQIRLDDRFRLLRGGRRGGLERHQTLRATVAWSYQLLTHDERILFDRLSVFAGGFDLVAAEAVCSDEVIDESDVVDLLGSLVDKSMVVADREGRTTRFRILEILRQYGEERLQDSGDTSAVRGRHLSHYLRRAQHARSLQSCPRQMEGQVLFDTEWDNLRSAYEWTTLTGDFGAAEDLVEATFVYAWLFFPIEHAEWANRLIEEADDQRQPRTSTYLAAGTWALFASDFEGEEELARRGIESDTDPRDVAVCGYFLATTLARRGRMDEALAALDTAEAKAAHSPDHYGMYWVLMGWAQIAGYRELPIMGAATERLMEFAMSTGAPWMIAGAHFMSALYWRRTRDFARAIESSRLGHALAVTTRSVALEGLAASQIVGATLAADDAVVTAECMDIVARLYDIRYWMPLWYCVESIADYLARRNDVPAAATLLGYLERHVAPGYEDSRLSRNVVAEIQRAHPETADDVRRGAAMSPDEIVAFTLDLLFATLLPDAEQGSPKPPAGDVGRTLE